MRIATGAARRERGARLPAQTLPKRTRACIPAAPPAPAHLHPRTRRIGVATKGEFKKHYILTNFSKRCKIYTIFCALNVNYNWYEPIIGVWMLYVKCQTRILSYRQTSSRNFKSTNRQKLLMKNTQNSINAECQIPVIALYLIDSSAKTEYGK